jgi:hypothetical protein
MRETDGGSGATTVRIRPRGLLVGLVVAVVALSAAHFAGLALWGVELPRSINLDEEDTVGTWFAASLHLVNAGLLALLAAESSRRERWRWMLLTTSVLIVSIDEVAGVHERVSGFLHREFHTFGMLAFAWIIPASLAVTVVAGLCAGTVLRRPGGRVVAAGAAVFIAGAVGIEVIGGWFSDIYGVGNVIYMALTGVEETMELVGAIIAMNGLLLMTRGFEIMIGMREPSQPRKP